MAQGQQSWAAADLFAVVNHNRVMASHARQLAAEMRDEMTRQLFLEDAEQLEEQAEQLLARSCSS